MTKRQLKQLFESVSKETSDDFLVVDVGLISSDDHYYMYLDEDGILQDFNDGELPDDAKLNPTVQEIVETLKEAFDGCRVIGGRKSMLTCAKEACATSKSYLTLRLFNEDYNEYEEVYKDVQLLSVDKPEIDLD